MKIMYTVLVVLVVLAVPVKPLHWQLTVNVARSVLWKITGNSSECFRN